MNLHEECLLKYLLNPMDLFDSTEMLELNNMLIEKNNAVSKKLVQPIKMRCLTNRV